VGGFPSVFTIASRLRLDASPSPLLVPAERPLVVVKRVCMPVMQCSWCAVVKTTLGSLWPAAQALPCHVVQTSTWAMVSVSPSSLLFSFFFGHGLWPTGQGQ
jgi:hypothetical protein